MATKGKSFISVWVDVLTKIPKATLGKKYRKQMIGEILEMNSKRKKERLVNLTDYQLALIYQVEIREWGIEEYQEWLRRQEG